MIDLIIIGGFLTLTLIMGLYHGRGITTFQDYAVGGKKMTTTVITLSMLATIYGGAMLSSRPNNYYHHGLYAFIIDLASPVNFYIAARFVIVRMKEFMGHLSIAESMGSLFGPIVRVYTAVLGIVISIAGLICQIKVGLNIITILFPDIEWLSGYSMTLLAILVVVYSSFGGARAVALTDVYQFLFFALCFPIVIFFCLYQSGHLAMQKLMEIPSFNLTKVFTWDDSLTCVLSHFVWRSIFPFDAARSQRFYMTSSIFQAQKVFNRTAVSRIFVLLLFLGLAMALHIGGHTIKPSQNLLYYIVDLAYFPGMRGILVTTLIALLMSTADSCLHVASVFFANDLWPVITKLKGRCNPSLTVARIASIAIGIISLIMVFYTTNVVQLLTKTFSLYGSVVSIPFIMACFGFRPRNISVLLSMVINTIIAVYRIYCSVPSAIAHAPLQAVVTSGKNIFLSLILSSFILVVLHLLLPKKPYTGWVGTKDNSFWELQNQTTKRWWLERLQRLKAPYTKGHQEKIFPKKASTFISLGIYVVISAMVALCFCMKSYVFPYIYGYMAVMAIGTIIALYPAFHSYQRGGNVLLHWIWPGLLFILLFLAPLLFAKLGHYGPMVSALWICSLSLGATLLSLEVMIGMLVIALFIHHWLPPYVAGLASFSASYTYLSTEPIYAIALIASTVVGMATYKRLRDKSAAQFKVIELTKTYEQRLSLEAIYNQAYWARLDADYGSNLLMEMSKMLQPTCHYLHTHNQEKLKQEVNLFTQKLEQFGALLRYRAKEERTLKLNPKAIQLVAIDMVIAKANQYILDLSQSISLLLRKQTPVKEILADPSLFECFLILNLWEIGKSSQAMDHLVVLTIANTRLQYGDITNEFSNERSLTLPAIAFCFSTDTVVPPILSRYTVTSPAITLPKAEAQFYQLESKQIVEAHGGYTQIVENNSTITCTYVWPIDGKQVIQFKNYDPADLVAGNVAETSASIAQEKELMTLLITQTTLTQEVVENTISFIKRAHGLVMRKSGAPYYTHPMAVTQILLEVTNDPDTLLAGLLHDVVEDTPITLHQIELTYGKEIAAIVDKLTEYNTDGYHWKLDKEENKAMLYACMDIRVVRVKLADRLHNIQTLYARKPIDQQRIAKETLTFYIPWGKRNSGPQPWLAEMKKICKKILMDTMNSSS